MRSVVILGSTGSIGTQALDVIGKNRDKFDVVGLAAGGGNLELLAQQAAAFDVPRVAIAREVEAEFRAAWQQQAPGRPAPEIETGPQAIVALAGSLDADGVVLNGVTGSVGLEPTLAALASGATLALANKESLVAGGGLVGRAMVRPGQIVPVDSEHSAIAQSLRGGRHNRGLTALNTNGDSEVRRIILTASGGPFRGKKREELAGVTPDQALAHPTWAMGPVVTINSSTLINKGLELIEAAYLFDVAPSHIDVVVHPQSVVHSMVEFVDGATISQASPPDMRLPIALGLSWPDRLDGVARPNDWTQPTSWTFEPVDDEAFPAVNLAREAVAESPLHPAVLNAANEECVAAFLDGRIGYLQIVDTVKAVVEAFEGERELDLDAVKHAESWARAAAHRLLGA